MLMLREKKARNNKFTCEL